ncbi:MAG: pitrilysin family protein [Pseudomonadota bacterium]
MGLFLGWVNLASAGGNTQDFTLENGMRVIVKEDHRAPIATSQVWYRVGSGYEQEGLTGISHALEHMMFKGTQRHGPNEFSRIIAENGGEENAFTSQDYTAYFQTLARDRLAVAFDLEADRMRHLSLDAGEFAKEIEVVKEERRLRTEDKPTALTLESFQATAYQVSPYRHPVIGWMSDLDAMTADDLKAWYRRWYAPNNAILVVVGDVEPEAVLALARQYFGVLGSEPLPTVKPRHDPAQRGSKRLVVKVPAKQPYLLIGYRVPVLKTTNEAWKPYALEMLSSLLSEGPSARLPRELVRARQIAVSAEVDYSAFQRLEDIFTFAATPTPQHNLDDLERAWREIVERIKTEPLDATELERVRSEEIAKHVYQQDSVFYQAMLMGSFEAVGLPWQWVDQYVDRLREVTPEQVQAVAREFLTDDNQTLARLEPLPMQGEARSGHQELEGSHHVR